MLLFHAASWKLNQVFIRFVILTCLIEWCWFGDRKCSNQTFFESKLDVHNVDLLYVGVGSWSVWIDVGSVWSFAQNRSSNLLSVSMWKLLLTSGCPPCQTIPVHAVTGKLAKLAFSRVGSVTEPTLFLFWLILTDNNKTHKSQVKRHRLPLKLEIQFVQIKTHTKSVGATFLLFWKF